MTAAESQNRHMAPVEDQVAVLMSGVEYGDEGLRRQFEGELHARLAEDRPLRVYLGIDPTATSLTLGHTVPLRKLRQFQDFGHHCVFLIGDYTALIGDPSDKNKLRPMLTSEDIRQNETTYFEQAARVLDASRTELRHNSEWLSKLMFPDLISLMSKFTVAEMLRRDNFRKRWDDGDAVYLHEFLYALMQGYDAFALECDVQVGGTEQLFNLMAGRKIQEDAGQRPHVPVTLPILVGLDGKERMSKSKGNHIGVGDTASEQYGKAMSIPDEAVMDFFVLATNVPRGDLEAIRHQLQRDPMGAKKRLARTIATEFWGDAAAAEAEAQFERTVQHREMPAEIPEITIGEDVSLLDAVVAGGLAPSKREARRLFEQGAVSSDGAESMSYEEFLEAPGPEWSEWVDGRMVAMPNVSLLHFRTTRWLTRLFDRYLDTTDAGMMLGEPFNMKTGADLPGRSPDLFFVLNEHLHLLRDNHLAGPADIVVEVTSPSTGPVDRGAKFYEYEAGGVREYWLIDPHRRVAEFHRLGADGHYAPAPVVDGVFESEVLPGLRFRVEWLWSRPALTEMA